MTDEKPDVRACRVRNTTMWPAHSSVVWHADGLGTQITPVPCGLFATCRCDHCSPSSIAHYFGQGGVVLNLTLALPGAVAHGVLRVSGERKRGNEKGDILLIR